MRTDMKKRICRGFVRLLIIVLCAAHVPAKVHAHETRTVRVAFFPMKGFHEYSEEDGYSGMDVAYLDELSIYTGWDMEYVECGSWDEALSMLEKQEVDLVGSAQYSEERAEIFDYAKLSSGYTFGCLYVEEGSSIAFEDFGQMEDKQFGVVESYIQKEAFLDYLDQNGISSPRLQEYKTTQELQEAVKTGQIDIAVHSLTEVWEGQYLVGKFAYEPFYYITWKGNQSLLDELNMGIEELKTNSPTLEGELMSLYYGGRRENFSVRELQFIRQNMNVKIGFYKDTRPLAYINKQGEYDGIYLEILRAVSERSGISIEFCPLDRSEYWKELLAEGKIDFYVGASNAKPARNDDIRLTSSFMPYNTVIVSKKDYAPSGGKVRTALTKGRAYLADSIDIKGDVIYCDSAKDCLKKLENDQAEITLLNTIEYNYYSKNERFANLIEWENYRYQTGTVLAASKNVDSAMFDVMNKALHFVSASEKEAVINQYMNLPYDSYEMIDYLYQTKDVIIGASIVLMLILVFGCALIHMRRKSYCLLEKKNGELKITMQEARKANQAKTEFLSHMSHDIRTPINGIMGMLNIAEEHAQDLEKQAECRKKIRTSTEHLLSLVNDVLDISKLESGNVEITGEVFFLPDILHNCVVIAGGQAAERRVELITDFDEEKLPHSYLVGSPLHLKQILINIAGNAVKFTKPMGNICFRCYEISAEDGIAQICFQISDTGIGMSKEYLQHIYEPFTQERSGARTNYQGAGLGMTITKNLIDKMGGTIRAESEPGKGSVFTVVIPMKIAAPPEEQEENEKDESVVLAGKKVLLVEDNELNQEIAQYILEERGLIVTVANDGKEAVELFQASEPFTYQLILMDVMMPVMNGHEATRAIRRLERPDAEEIPIIAMTANAFTEDVKAAKEAGMNEHLAKPIDLKILDRVLIQWLRSC